MKKTTFYHIVSMVSEEMRPGMMNLQSINLIMTADLYLAAEFVRRPIPLDMRVGIAIYKLASSGEYRSVANTFGVGVSTVQKFVQM